MGQGGLELVPGMIGDVIFTVILRVALAGGVLAAIDYIFQRWRYNKSLKMTHQEIKEELREMDGDPQIKSRIRKLQRELARRRMMDAVPDATAVVTNPTHFAVALRYESGKTRAPIVVAKGQDYVAEQIKTIASKHNVPVIENPFLARTLYSSVRVGQEIPAQLYRAVAEIIAFVYRLKRRW
jgi:flagellar biosynthesis protein FlhB